MIEVIALVLTGLGLAASIVHYANIINNANKTRELQLKAQELAVETRQVQIFMRYLDRIWDPDIQEVYETVYPHFSNVDEFMEKFREDRNFQRVFFRWAYYWENTGMFLKLGYLPIEFVTTSPSIMTAIFLAWERTRDVVYRLRESGRSNKDFAMWEYLYNETMNYFKEHPEEAT